MSSYPMQCPLARELPLMLGTRYRFSSRSVIHVGDGGSGLGQAYTLCIVASVGRSPFHQASQCRAASGNLHLGSTTWQVPSNKETKRKLVRPVIPTLRTPTWAVTRRSTFTTALSRNLRGWISMKQGIMTLIIMIIVWMPVRPMKMCHIQ